MSSFRYILSCLSPCLSIGMIVLIAAAGAFQFVGLLLDDPGPLPMAKVVAISKGMNVDDIAERLQREGVIDHKTLFLFGSAVQQVTTRLQAGEFLFRKHASVNEILDILVDGDPVFYDIVIPEGLTSIQIVQLLKSNKILTGKVENKVSEGVFLPGTYRFIRKTTRVAILKRMRVAQQRAVDRIWQNRAKNLPFKSSTEMIILASIVEKETGWKGERARIASVFINRLKKLMRLQADPTVIYGVTGGTGSLGRGLLTKELQKITPYNTYRIAGLPPTPISNPGIAALKAVAHPDETDDLYFVADGSGGHVFSSTLQEHNRNVASWRKVMRAKLRQKVDNIKKSAEE